MEAAFTISTERPDPDMRSPFRFLDLPKGIALHVCD
jgi:hypothetical protein